MKHVTCWLTVVLILAAVAMVLPSGRALAANYSGYMYDTEKHWVANCGNGENGATGNEAGDQTMQEYWLKTLGSYQYTVVYRHPNRSVAEMIARMSIDAALNDRIGYDRNWPDRTTFWSELEAVNYNPASIMVYCEADCATSTCAIIKAVGYKKGIPALQNLDAEANTATMGSKLVEAGFQTLTDPIYINSNNYLLPGDILWRPGHVFVNLTEGSQED